MVSVADLADRASRALAESETLSLGQRRVTWLDTPHVPHAWECGPVTVACMHGSAWRGAGGALLRALAEALDR